MKKLTCCFLFYPIVLSLKSFIFVIFVSLHNIGTLFPLLSASIESLFLIVSIPFIVKTSAKKG